MKTKNMYRILAICCALLVMMGTTTALAIESRASEMFNETYVMVNSKLETEFGAGTKKIAKSIYVSSCILQELDKNNRVIASTNLTPPDKVVNNGSDYTATAKYSGIPRSILQSMNRIFCSTKRRKKRSMNRACKSCLQSKSCKTNTQSCWYRRKGTTLRTDKRVMRCGNCSKPRRTWIAF